MNTQLIKKNILFGILHAAFLSPFIFFMLGMPMILQMEGFDSKLIGMFQMVGLPAVIKFLFSVPIDKFIFEKNHYKKWIIFITVLYAILLFAISFLSLQDNVYIVLFAIMLTTLVATFVDIPLNALSIKVFTKEERIIAGSYKSSSFFVAALLGGGVFLLFYNHLAWQNTFIIMSILVLISLFALYFIEENNKTIKEEPVSFKALISFFKQENIGIWVFILSFYFAFISAVWVFLKPYLILKGVSPDNVAFYVGIYGSIIGFFAGFIASIVGKKFSKKSILILFAFVNIITILSLFSIEYFEHFSYFALLVVVTLSAASITFSSAIIFSLIMDYSRSSSKAVDYAIQSSLFSLTRIISAVIAGIIISNFDYKVMFLFEALAVVLVVFVIYKFYKG